MVQFNSKNRITEACEHYRKVIDGFRSDREEEKIAVLEENAIADDDEMVVIFQKMQAKASAMGIFNLDEAMTLYNFFGKENPTAEHFNGLALEERIVGVQVITELMDS